MAGYRPIPTGKHMSIMSQPLGKKMDGQTHTNHENFQTWFSSHDVELVESCTRFQNKPCHLGQCALTFLVGLLLLIATHN